jgi:hypothetical protein
MPEATSQARIDAVLVPQHYPRGKAAMDRGVALKAEFAPVLGSKGKDFYPRRSGMTETLITTSEPRNHRYWPSDHPNAGQEFYDWTDRGDGVLYGTLTDDAKAYLSEGQ